MYIYREREKEWRGGEEEREARQEKDRERWDLVNVERNAGEVVRAI